MRRRIVESSSRSEPGLLVELSAVTNRSALTVAKDQLKALGFIPRLSLVINGKLDSGG